MCRKQDIHDKIMANVGIHHMGFKVNGYYSPCHLWQGSDSGTGRGGGYPRMSLDGQTVAVHIVSFVNKNGFVPGKKQIDHLCNNRMCVNPDHLEMVTHKQNQRRRDQRKKENSNAPTPQVYCITPGDESYFGPARTSKGQGNRRVQEVRREPSRASV